MRWFAGRMVDGFAWMLGASAAKDVYAELRKEEAPDADPRATEPTKDPVVEAREREKRLKAEAKVRAKAKQKLDREIEAELEALKKRVARGE